MTSTLGGEYLNRQHQQWHTCHKMLGLADDTEQKLVQCSIKMNQQSCTN